MAAATVVADYANFEREVNALGAELRRNVSREDFRHLRRIEWIGWLCTVVGYILAPIMPNPLSPVLLAQGMLVRFVIRHHVAHGSYDTIPGIPERFTRQHFSSGWNRYAAWVEWWSPEDWAFAHNHLHHQHLQGPKDSDILDTTFLRGFPMWARWVVFVLAIATWKFSFYAPSIRRARLAVESARAERRRTGPTPQPSPAEGLTRILAGFAIGTYTLYVLFRIVVPTLVFLPLGSDAALSVLINIALAELLHNAHTFLVSRPSHCAGDIPMFSSGFANRREFYVQTMLGTVNYYGGTEAKDVLYGWTNYQVEHHLWPTLPLLQYRKGRERLIDICRRNGVPYRQGSVISRFQKTARLFLGLDEQPVVDTKELIASS